MERALNSSDKKQLRNAGNWGDIVKHVALIAQMGALRKQKGRMLYAETHAFRPVAQISTERASLWNKEINGMPDVDAKQVYAQIQEPYISNERYMCSTGIANHMVIGRTSGDTDFVFCESGSESRELLKQYAWTTEHVRILENNEQLPKYLQNHKSRYDLVLAHIDPHSLSQVNESLFIEWLEALTRSAKQDSPMLVLVFNWRDRAWPSNEGSPVTLCASYLTHSSANGNNIPISLGLYANKAGFCLVKKALFSLGWNERSTVKGQDF